MKSVNSIDDLIEDGLDVNVTELTMPSSVWSLDGIRKLQYLKQLTLNCEVDNSCEDDVGEIVNLYDEFELSKHCESVNGKVKRRKILADYYKNIKSELKSLNEVVQGNSSFSRRTGFLSFFKRLKDRELMARARKCINNYDLKGCMNYLKEFLLLSKFEESNDLRDEVVKGVKRYIQFNEGLDLKSYSQIDDYVECQNSKEFGLIDKRFSSSMFQEPNSEISEINRYTALKNSSFSRIEEARDYIENKLINTPTFSELYAAARSLPILPSPPSPIPLKHLIINAADNVFVSNEQNIPGIDSSLQFFNDINLKNLSISGYVPHRFCLPMFFSKHLKKGLQVLNLSGLKYCTKLKIPKRIVKLRQENHFDSFSPMFQPRSMNELIIGSDFHFTEGKKEKVEVIKPKFVFKFDDGFVYDIRKFDLSFLRDYESIKELVLDNSIYRDLSVLCEAPFVKNRVLKRVSVKGLTDILSKKVDNGMTNGQILMMIHEKYGVEVIADEFHYNPSLKSRKVSLIHDFFQKFYVDENEFEEYVGRALIGLDKFEAMNGGYSSVAVVDLDECVLKIGTKDQIAKECCVYKLLKNTSINNLVPFFYDYEFGFDVGLMKIKKLFQNDFILPESILCSQENLKTKRIFHNLNIMARFHYEVTEEANCAGIVFKPEQYDNSISNPNLFLTVDPLKNTYSVFKEHLLSKYQLTEIVKYVSDVADYVSKNAKVVIHGDYKPENTDFNSIYDFSATQLGCELQDIMRYLTSCAIDCGVEEARFWVKEYIKIRSTIDVNFKDSVNYRREILERSDDFYLFETAVFYSRSVKRDLLNPEKLFERDYYYNKLNVLV